MKQALMRLSFCILRSVEETHAIRNEGREAGAETLAKTGGMCLVNYLIK